MWLDILLLIAGLVLILVGANLLTDGSSSLASRWGVSDMVIGLTVVAFGTSTPELVISVVSAINGSGGLAIGNAVGSNIFNILLVIGLTALIKPMTVDRNAMTVDIPLVLLSSVVLMVMGIGPWLGDDIGRMLWRSDGIILLLFFAIFMRNALSRSKTPGPGSDVPAADAVKAMPMGKSVLWVVAGLAGLIFGGDLFVDSATGIAKSLGVSEAVIGLTIVAIGTSLPELAATIAAALKNKPGLALGNVIGSNIFNIFLVLGTSATVRPLAFGSIGIVDLSVLVVASVLFWVFGWFFARRTITRAEGLILLLGYAGYMTWLLVNA